MLSYFCWQASVATHCMLVATAGKPLAQLSKFIKYYHVVSWGLPVIVSIVLYCLQFVNIPGIPRGAPVWQSATFFCWISNNYATMRMVFFYGPLWATFVYAVVCYVYTWRRLTRSRNMFGRSGGGGGGGSEDDNSCNPPSATSTQPQQQSVIISSTGANSSLSVMARANSQTQAQQQLKRGHQRFIMKCTCYMLAFVVNWSFATINRSQNIIAPQVNNWAQPVKECVYFFEPSLTFFLSPFKVTHLCLVPLTFHLFTSSRRLQRCHLLLLYDPVT